MASMPRMRGPVPQLAAVQLSALGSFILGLLSAGF